MCSKSTTRESTVLFVRTDGSALVIENICNIKNESNPTNIWFNVFTDNIFHLLNCIQTSIHCVPIKKSINYYQFWFSKYYGGIPHIGSGPQFSVDKNMFLMLIFG